MASGYDKSVDEGGIMKKQEDHLQKVSSTELATHNNQNSTWISVEGMVYDVTEYKDRHPGGDEILLKNSGMDATDIFTQVGHTKSARKHMKNFLVGELIGESKEWNRKKAISIDDRSDTAYEEILYPAANDKMFFGSFLKSKLTISVILAAAGAIYYAIAHRKS